MTVVATKTIVWSQTTPNDGDFFEAEFNRIYSNTNDLQSQVTGISAIVKPLQVVSVTKTDTFSHSGSVGVFADITGLSATITPQSATSKIIILASVSRGVGADVITYFRIMRDATPILIGDSAGSRTRSTGTVYLGSSAASSQLVTIPLNGEDTPSSVTAITYKIQIASDGGSVHYVNRSGTDADIAVHSRTISTLILMEVGA
jgi:hypothetical protein